MSTQRVTLAQADGHLAELIAAVERGDEVIIESAHKTQVKLVTVPSARASRVLGAYRGKLRMAADFDAPLPEEFWLSGRP
ncbi:MAG TPA: hypothetical protein VFY12_12980 [Arenimonas sp.]|nr:hypothetical protein [Arenimonas sp.]